MMKKSSIILISSATIFGLYSIALAATTSPFTSLPTSTTTPTTTTQSTTPTTDPLAISDPFALNPALLQNAGTTTPTTTVPTDPNPNGTVGTIPTPIPPAVISVPPTKTPPASTVPPRTVPPRTLPPAVVIDTPPNEIPEESCPPISPLSKENVECPKTETVKVIPQFPLVVLATPIFAVVLFWLIIGYLNNGQIRTEKRFTANSLATAHRQNVDRTKTREYENLLDFLTNELSSPDGFHPDKFELLSSKIQLLGSTEMQTLSSKIGDAIKSNDKQALKSLIKDLGRQIKKEL